MSVEKDFVIGLFIGAILFSIPCLIAYILSTK